ncbi:MAG: AsmA family protein [Bacteroidales bacterium]
MKAVKVIKKTGKILLITLLSLILVLVILVVVALHSENTIARLALKEVSTMIDAPVEVENISLRLFRNFPYTTVEFNNFKLGVSYKTFADSTESHEADTLLSLRKLYVSLKTMPLLKNQIEIEKVEIEGFVTNYSVDSLGISNLDFLMASDTTEADTIAEVEPQDTTASILDVLLSDLTIRDITVNFTDEQMKAAARVHIPEMDIAGRVLDEYYAGSVRGSILITNGRFDDTNLFLMEETSLGFEINYDDGDVTFESLDFLTDGAKLNAKGRAVLGDSIFVDMGVNLSDIDFKVLSKYAPAEIIEEFGLVGIEGVVDMETKIKGYVYDTLLLPSVDASIALKDGSISTADYPSIKHLSFKGEVSAPNPNDMNTMSASFRSVRMATEHSNFNVAFDVRNFNKPIYDVKSNAVITLDEFNDYLPDSTVEYMAGRVNLNFATHGQLPDDLGMNSADYFLDRTRLDVKLRDFSTAMDSVQEVKNFSADFSYKPNRQIALRNLSMEAPSYNVAIDNLTILAGLTGLVSDMDNMGVNVDSLYFVMGNTSLDAKATVQGLDKPTYTISSNLNVDLDELRPHIPDSLVEHISGKIAMSLESYGTIDLDSIEQQAMPIAFEQSKLGLNVKDFSFAMPDDTLSKVNSLNLNFAMANDTIWVDNFHANAHGIDVWIDSTKVWNVYKAFLLEQKDKEIIVNTHIKVSDIDYANFAHLVETDTTQATEEKEDVTLALEEGEEATENLQEIAEKVDSTEKEPLKEQVAADTTAEETPMYIPPFIARGTFALNSAKYDDIFVQDIFTKFRVDDSLYVIDDFRFKAFGGEMVTSAVYDMRDDSLTTVMFKNKVNKMDVHQMLVDGDNFDQDDISHENISGILTSSVDGRIVMQGDSIYYDKINLMGYFKLENGGIYNFEPAMELSKFTNLRELDNIVFRTLESSVFIYKNNIYFPKTDIVSTAVDMSAYGMQSFDEDYEYHLTLHLSDVLLGKSDKLLEKQGKESDLFEGEDTSERRGLYLVSLNRDGKSKHGFDNKRLQKIMSTTIRIQERGLNLMFHPRLANYSTDLDRKEVKKKKEEEEEKEEDKEENEEEEEKNEEKNED